MSAATPTPLVAACDWSIVVLARSEAAALARCLAAIRVAAAGQDAQVTVLLTGRAEASVAVAEGFAAAGGPRLRVFHIPHADRANAWNQYVHALRPEAAMHVFVEAHAAMAPEALRSLAAALAEHPASMAATGLPCSGPRAAAVRAGLRRGGQLHGALHALRGEFLDGIAKAGLRLPVGLGEIHPVIAGLLGAGLLGEGIVVAEEAGWRAAPLNWFSPQSAVRAWRRRLRQARAGFEAEALAGVEPLPETAAPLLRDWLAGRPRPSGFFPWLASRRLAREGTPAYGDLLPRRVALADVAISPRASGPRPAPAA